MAAFFYEIEAFLQKPSDARTVWCILVHLAATGGAGEHRDARRFRCGPGHVHDSNKQKQAALRSGHDMQRLQERLVSIAKVVSKGQPDVVLRDAPHPPDQLTHAARDGQAAAGEDPGRRRPMGHEAPGPPPRSGSSRGHPQCGP